jgi:hypothetical protein
MRVTIFAVEKKKYYLSVFVSVALLIQYAVLMHRVILSSLACSVVHTFLTLSHKRHDFGENVIEYEMCFDFLRKFV